MSRSAPDPGSRLVAPVLAALLVLGLAAPVHGQEVEDRLRTLGVENGRLYLHPVSAGLAAGLASGWSHSAATLDFGTVDLSVRVTGSIVPEEDESFEPVLPASITVPELDGRTFSDPYGDGEGLRTPTAAGAGGGTRVEPQGELLQAIQEEGLDPDDFAFRFPDGFDIPTLPIAVLQGSVGLPAGTQATMRLVPEMVVNEDVGPLSSLGFGVKHSLSQWVPGSTPVDVALEAGVQTFDAGDYLSADSRHASLAVSREVGVLTLYASGGLEDSEVDVSYTLRNPRSGGEDVEVAFTEEGENSTRFTGGFHLDLLFLQLNAGYTVAEYPVLNASFGVRF